jgi:predicted nucleic acid-binding Zn ribbon protein
MPIYLYQHKKTKEVREVLQSMNDVHKYYGDKEQPEDVWERIFTVPTASIDTKQDPFNANQFVRSTANKKGTYGDLLDQSKELSDKRASLTGGLDPIKEEYYKNYSKQRNGALHQDKFKKTFENKHVKAEL